MNQSQQTKLYSSFADSFQSIFSGNLWEWCEENVILPEVYAISGPFNSSVSPYLKQPMEDMTASNIRQINLACCTQTGKSLIEEVLMPYIILQDPSPILRIHQSQPAAADCMQTRVIPILNNNPKIAALTKNVQYNGKSGMFNLGNMFIKAVGTSENNLHGLSIRWAILDEVWLYEDDNVVNKVRARTTAFEKNYKLILSSQPDTEGSQLHREYTKGNIYIYGFRCPKCNELQLYEFDGKQGKSGLNWLSDNTISMDKRTDHTVLTCAHCHHNIEDTEENRINLVQNGDYILTQEGDPTIHSYSWPAFVNKDITFKKIAMKWWQAKQVYENTGITEDLKLFRNQVLGLFWKKGEQVDSPKLLQDNTTTNEDWTDETHRFMTVDVQIGCIYWLVTAWSNKVSEARLIDWGVCVGYDELNNIRKKYKVKPFAVGIDSGDQTMSIYKESILRGEWYTLSSGRKIWAQWICLKGDGGHGISPKIDYIHPDGSKRYYGCETQADPQWKAGSTFAKYRAKLYLWSNYSIKILISNMISNRLPFKFKFNHRADETFTRHMYSEYIDPKNGRFVKKEGVDNHLWDCLCEAMVMAIMGKCFIPEPSLSEDTVITKPETTVSLQPALKQVQ